MEWNKRTKTIALIAGIIFLIVIIILITTGKSKAKTKEKSLPADQDQNPKVLTPEENSKTSIEPPITETFPLKRSKQGKEVEQAQMYLIKNFGAKFPDHGVDGIWGKETEANMMKHLKKNSISKDFFYKVGMDKFKTINFK